MSSKYLTPRQLGLGIVYLTFFGPLPFAATFKPGKYQAEIKGFINQKQAKAKGNTEEDRYATIYTGSQAHNFKGLVNIHPIRFTLGLLSLPILLPTITITLITATIAKRLVDVAVTLFKALGSIFKSKQITNLNENEAAKEEAVPEYVLLPVKGVKTTRRLGTYEVQPEPEVMQGNSPSNTATENDDNGSVENCTSSCSGLSPR